MRKVTYIVKRDIAWHCRAQGLSGEEGIENAPDSLLRKADGAGPSLMFLARTSAKEAASGAGPPLYHHDLGCPTLRDFRSVGTTDLDAMFTRHRPRAGLPATYLEIPNRLHRYYGAGYLHLHFITTSCYQRRALLCTRQNRDLFLQVWERVRRRYHFVVAGCVVVPEHVHLLIGEHERANPSLVMQALKQGFALRLLRKLRSAVDPRQGRLAGSAAFEEGHIGQRRFYDFVVFSERK